MENGLDANERAFVIFHFHPKVFSIVVITTFTKWVTVASQWATSEEPRKSRVALACMERGTSRVQVLRER